MAVGTEERRVGRKRREIAGRQVKLDGDIVAMAEYLARKSGQTTGNYMSAILRPIIEREFKKVAPDVLRPEGGKRE